MPPPPLPPPSRPPRLLHLRLHHLLLPCLCGERGEGGHRCVRRRRPRPSTPLLSLSAPARWSRGVRRARRGRGKMREEEEEDQAVARPPDPRRVGAEAAAVAGATEAGAAAPGPDLGRVLLPLRLHGGSRLEAGEQQMRWRRHERSGGGRVELRRDAARVRGDGGGSGCSGPRSGEGTRQGGTPSSPFQTFSYMAERIVGTGLFGIVFQAKCLETGETMAIKKVLQDRRYKNWELQLMCTVNHSNVVSLKDCFFSTTSRDELFLNLVMEYIPETFYRVLNNYSNAKQGMPLIYLKLYTYQGPCVHSYCSWSLS